MATRALIIGGDAAGMSAASKIKRELQDAEVIVFEKTQTISYSACGMPYWIGGSRSGRGSARRDAGSRAHETRHRRALQHEAIAIDPENRRVTVVDQATGKTLEEPYDVLVIATGARAILPPIPGMDLPGVFTLRAFADSQSIYRYLAEFDPEDAVVIGGGYIGVEMAEALCDRELDVHIVEMLPQLMPNFDADMVEEMTRHVTEQGVTLHMGAQSRASSVGATASSSS